MGNLTNHTHATLCNTDYGTGTTGHHTGGNHSGNFSGNHFASSGHAVSHIVSNLTLDKDSCTLRRMTAEETLAQGEFLHDHCMLGGQLGFALRTFLLITIFFCLMTKYVNSALVRLYMKDSELLFILAMVYSLGTCAVCHQIGFSPVVGAYIAGVYLSFLPSRVQIYSKISSLRGLGTTLFFFMLGVHVHIDGEIFNHVFSWAVFITFLVSCVQPVLMILMGWVSGLKSCTIVYAALLHNSLGEKALI